MGRIGLFEEFEKSAMENLSGKNILIVYDKYSVLKIKRILGIKNILRHLIELLCQFNFIKRP